MWQLVLEAGSHATLTPTLPLTPNLNPALTLTYYPLGGLASHAERATLRDALRLRVGVARSGLGLGLGLG